MMETRTITETDAVGMDGKDGREMQGDDAGDRGDQNVGGTHDDLIVVPLHVRRVLLIGLLKDREELPTQAIHNFHRYVCSDASAVTSHVVPAHGMDNARHTCRAIKPEHNLHSRR